jgi:hypothetical protein
MMKKLITVIAAIVISLSSFGQSVTVLPNGNVGIGTGATAPTQKLHVVGNTYMNGNLGLGTTPSSYKLHVVGDSYFNGNSYVNGNLGLGTTSPSYKLHVAGNSYFNGNSYVSGNFGLGTTSPSYKLHVAGVSYLNGNSYITGNVGIGTTSPAQKLHVEGNSYVTGNVGIGTTSTTEKLYVAGNSIITGKVAIGTTETDPGLMLRVVGDMGVTRIGVSNIGIGYGMASLNPAYRLQVGGNAQFANDANQTYYLKISPSSQPCIGSNTGVINCWESISGFNTLVAKKYSTSSDSILKTDIRPIENATATLKKIHTHSYYFKSDPVETRRREYGVLAQEIEAVLPELVSTIKIEDEIETKAVNYNGFIPFLIKGFNEQQTFIEKQQQENMELDALRHTIQEQQGIIGNLQKEFQQETSSLKKEIELLKEALKTCCKTNQPKTLQGEENNSTQEFNLTDPANAGTDEMKVYQNAPNPFNTTTTIQCYIPQTVQHVELCVYNMQGARIKCLTLSERGTVNVQIQAGELSAGVYTYLLIGDGNTSEAKQMILTK